MNVVEHIELLRKIRWQNPLENWGLVPTMGFLHEGHLSLVRLAKMENDRVGVSIFVNPAQFNNSADLEKYPRNLQRDLDMLAAEGVDLVWTPTPEMAYPDNFQTYVNVEDITQPLEGEKRPGHFRGVTTIVAKLFNVFQPQRVYFGQKDAQQVAVIRRMATDLNFNLEMVVCPTVREADGLAMSSRNARLSPEARQDALCLYRALQTAEALVQSGEQRASKIIAAMREIIEPIERANIDYISIADPETLAEVAEIRQHALISMAVFVDDVRLIDNVLVESKF